MSQKKEIQNVYQYVSSHTGFYDGIMDYRNLPMKLIEYGLEKNCYYQEKVLSVVPKNFSGKLLEIPVGIKL